MLFFRSIAAAVTINTIVLYFMMGNIAWFNVSISAWCFAEWMAVFQEAEKNDILHWLLPPLNQLCLLIRVFATELNKIV